MSSWKNASKANQRTHRERHQPEARKHLGLLEKKKDYRVRADDYNEKKAQLQYLHKRALDRNPEEFYYHMINSKVEDGVHKGKRKEVVLTPEQVQLMQTQDYKYIATRSNMELQKVNRLQSNLHSIQESSLNKHTFFVDDKKEMKTFRLTKKLDTPAELVGRRYNRIRNADLDKIDLAKLISGPDVAQVNKLKQKSYKELNLRADRQKKLSTLQRKLEIKRALQDKTRSVKRKVAPESADAAPIYEWRATRKK